MAAPGGPIQVGSVSKKPQHGATTMERTYEVTDRADKRAVAEFLKREGPVTGGLIPSSPHDLRGEAAGARPVQRLVRGLAWYSLAPFL